MVSAGGDQSASSQDSATKKREGAPPPPPPQSSKRPRLDDTKLEETYLRSIPSARQYEKSFMHRDTITHVVATKTDFIVTASQDGHLKFWKKRYGEGVEFVKHFRCHLSAFSHLAVNWDGQLLATVCRADKSVKVFDVSNFDMINMLKLDFEPRTAAWSHSGSDATASLIVSDSASGRLVVFDGKGGADPLHELKIHSAPVTSIDYNHRLGVGISADSAGMLEYWSGEKGDWKHPESAVEWKFKTETDLYELLKAKTSAIQVLVSPDGRKFAAAGLDRKIRVFDFIRGKLLATFDETLQAYMETAKTCRNFGLQSMEWTRRVAQEKDFDKDRAAVFRNFSLAWDESSHFLLVPSMIGVKVLNVATGDVARRIGADETVRFVGASLCRALPSVRDKLLGAATSIEVEAADNPNLAQRTDPDPVLVCCAHSKGRFYLFTNSEPYSTEAENADDNTGTYRDVFNERPQKEDQITAVETGKETALELGATGSKLAEAAIIHTSMGDIHVKLYVQETPKTVENFCLLVRRGHYTGLCWHRIVRSFMIQTGDPTGKGTGGQSAWGDDFEDEFHPRLKHDKPFMLSMANAGPNTNGSQFFITICPAPWLDGKNTNFGYVTEGFNVVQNICSVPTWERSGRPRQEVKLISISLK